MKNFFRFFISKIFLKNIFVIIIMIIAVLWGSFTWLNKFTNHGESLKVPNFTGMRINEVHEIKNTEQLHFEIIDSVYNQRGIKGVIIDQTPPAGFRVKENRTIFLTINAWTQEKIAAPNVIGISAVQAKADLESNGLRLGKMLFMPSDYQKLVLEQRFNGRELAPGSKIPKNSQIDLIVGLGLDEKEAKSKIPNLMGLTLEQARNKALTSFLNIGEITYDNTVENFGDSTKAKVFEQSPLHISNKDFEFGTSINVSLTTNENKVKLSALAVEESVTVDVPTAEEEAEEQEDIF